MCKISVRKMRTRSFFAKNQECSGKAHYCTRKLEKCYRRHDRKNNNSHPKECQQTMTHYKEKFHCLIGMKMKCQTYHSHFTARLHECRNIYNKMHIYVLGGNWQAYILYYITLLLSSNFIAFHISTKGTYFLVLICMKYNIDQF